MDGKKACGRWMRNYIIKTGLTCTCNCTRSMNHNFPCEVANTSNFTSCIVLCLFTVVSNLYAYRLLTNSVMCLQIIKLDVQI